MSKNALYGRRILLGCGAGISLYKVCYLLRGLVRRGAEVKILLSERAKRIIHPSIFSSLAKNEVLWDQFQDQQFKPQHVRLAQWAELFLVAPATADLMTRFALGLADELITTTCLSMGGVPVILVPAMEENMWFHPATRRSADLLKERGAIFIGPDKGGLASGKKGMGRMAEPVRIIEELTQFFRERETLRGKRVLVISGPTREYLDSVRYLTNSSSGIMGRFLAEEGSLRGAEVTFITGPATVMPCGINKTVRVTAADEMLRQAIKYAPKADYVIGCAAVADFTPEKRVNKKIPRDRQTREVSLKVTEDILSALTSRRRKGQYFAGFSLENGFDLLRAREKMSRKGLDMIILNPVSSMERETASAWILKGRAVRRFHNVSKKVLAREIWNEILNK